MFNVKDPVPFHLRLHVVYQFTCAGCNVCYVGETFRHAFVSIWAGTGPLTFSTICKTLTNVEDSVQIVLFSILDIAPDRLQLNLKEAAHIRWTNPTLNRQLKHAELTLSF